MLQILIFGSAMSTLLSPPVNVLFALDKFKLIAMGGLFFIVVNTIGHLVLTSQYGGTGAAVVQVLSHLALNCCFALNVCSVFYAKKKLDMTAFAIYMDQGKQADALRMVDDGRIRSSSRASAVVVERDGPLVHAQILGIGKVWIYKTFLLL